MLERCLHINICVRDLDRSIHFYQQLGFETCIGPLKVEDPKYAESIGLPGVIKKARVAFVRLPGDPYSPMLDLAEMIDPPAVGEAYPNLMNVGICRIAFAVSDIERVWTRLNDLGAAFVTAIVDMEVQGVLTQRVLMFKDPDGCVLEAVQLMDTPFNAPWMRPASSSGPTA